MTLKDDLERGSLVMPFNANVKTDVAYHLITPAEDNDLPRTSRAFVDWILAAFRQPD